jgi:hypothetical protein
MSPLTDDRLAPNGRTRADNFKTWFSDSKVVDENQQPLVVFHGTNSAFDAFDPERTMDGAFWFTTDASGIAGQSVGASGSKCTMPVYLRANKLAGWDEYDRLTHDQLIAQGFDGVKLDNDFIVFDPKQIKSVSNSGLFDPQSNSISDGGLPPPEWTHRMIEACTANEAGFHFEEGGCFAMARALHESFSKEDPFAAIAINRFFCHVVVRSGGVVHDHQGHLSAEQALNYTEIVAPEELEALALAAGQRPDEFDSDVDWARRVIRTAHEMAAVSNQIAPEHQAKPSDPSSCRSLIPVWVDHLAEACEAFNAREFFENEGSLVLAKALLDDIALIQPKATVLATAEMSHAAVFLGPVGVGVEGTIDPAERGSYTQELSPSVLESIAKDPHLPPSSLELAQDVIEMAKLLCIKARKEQDLPDLWLSNGTEIAHHINRTTPGGVHLEMVEEMMTGAQAVLVRVPVDQLEEDLANASNHMPVLGREVAYATMPAETVPPLLLNEQGVLQDGAHRLRTARKRGDATLLVYQMIDAQVDLKIPRNMLFGLKHR